MTYTIDTALPAVTLVSGPAAEPVTKAEVKLTAGYDSDLTAHDTLLDDIWIPAARRECEHLTGRKLITQTWDIALDAFPADAIDLSVLSPIASITSVTYLDGAGAQQTLSSSAYVLDAKNDAQPYLLLADGYDWPTTYDSANAVIIRVVVGYGDAASDVPADVRAWLLAKAASMIPNSGVEMTDTLMRLLDGATIRRA